MFREMRVIPAQLSGGLDLQHLSMFSAILEQRTQFLLPSSTHGVEASKYKKSEIKTGKTVTCPQSYQRDVLACNRHDAAVCKHNSALAVLSCTSPHADVVPQLEELACAAIHKLEEAAPPSCKPSCTHALLHEPGPGALKEDVLIFRVC